MKKFAPLALSASLLAANAYAEPAYEGMAKPWQLGFQEPATPVMEQLNSVHNELLVIITLITVFVLMLMAYIAIRFRRSVSPVASKTTHNTLLEIIWTGIPIIILVFIAFPSLKLHYYMQRVVNPDMTLKVVGYQWYWHYDYPDQGGFGFDSYLKKDHLSPGEHRMLAVDNHVVVPVDTTVRVLVTGADVIHSWAMPAFGVKRDGIPGRLNESWFKATKIGTFYGQCSELCGVGHGFMPIVVDVVSKDDFAAWVKQKQKENNITAPAAAISTETPVAKPESAAAKNPEPAASQQKARSDAGASGKPSKPAPAPIPPVNNMPPAKKTLDKAPTPANPEDAAITSDTKAPKSAPAATVKPSKPAPPSLSGDNSSPSSKPSEKPVDTKDATAPDDAAEPDDNKDGEKPADTSEKN